MLKRSKDYQAELHYEDTNNHYMPIEHEGKFEFTVDVRKAGAMANQSFGCGKEIVETYAETYLLNDFVCVFSVYVVFDCLRCIFSEVLRGDLD
jgi:hypothetical protein